MVTVVNIIKVVLQKDNNNINNNYHYHFITIIIKRIDFA